MPSSSWDNQEIPENGLITGVQQSVHFTLDLTRTCLLWVVNLLRDATSEVYSIIDLPFLYVRHQWPIENPATRN